MKLGSGVSTHLEACDADPSRARGRVGSGSLHALYLFRRRLVVVQDGPKLDVHDVWRLELVRQILQHDSLVVHMSADVGGRRARTTHLLKSFALRRLDIAVVVHLAG